MPDSILLGWGLFVGFATMCLIAVKIAPGVHMWDFRLKNLASYLYVSYANYSAGIFLFIRT